MHRSGTSARYLRCQMSFDQAIITVDPRFRLPYYTFILQGFADLGVHVRFRRLDKPDGDGMALLLHGRRIWVDTNDMARVEQLPYEWADVVGKANLATADVADYKSIRLLGPVFGTRIYALPTGYRRLVPMLMGGASLRPALAGIRFQGITRLPISEYYRGTSEGNYVFHRSRPWAGKHDATNQPRQRFITALDGLGFESEVGFSDERIPLSEYLKNTRRSSVVFNCPAVHGCLGWKLGEYLALGKAIISTPLNRALPAPLVHGENVHFVEDDVESIRTAIVKICSDEEYRRHLEEGARGWYERNMTPAVAAARLIHE